MINNQIYEDFSFISVDPIILVHIMTDMGTDGDYISFFKLSDFRYYLRRQIEILVALFIAI